MNKFNEKDIINITGELPRHILKLTDVLLRSFGKVNLEKCHIHRIVFKNIGHILKKIKKSQTMFYNPTQQGSSEHLTKQCHYNCFNLNWNMPSSILLNI